ncbi:MAG: TolC family protein, partial [Limnochordales bacterium]
KEENSWRVTELNALQAERNFYNQVTSAWHSLMDAARRLESAAIDYELAQSAFAVARRQHEVGLTTDIEWERAQLDHINAQQSYRDAVVSYVRTRLDLLNLIGHPFELDEEFAGR